MKPQAKKLWLQALRSGDYPQCEAMLHNDDGYCCLGVLQDIKRGPGVEWHPAISESRSFGTVPLTIEKNPRLYDDGDGWHGVRVLTPRFMRQVGLTGKDQSHLTGMNDAGRSFGEIADWIEANL